MRLYELTYLIPSNLGEEEIKALQEKIVSQIQAIGGILNEVSAAIKKSLAYPIKKNTSAFLVTLSFQLAPEKVDLFHKKLTLEPNILRFLILEKKLPKKMVALPVKKPKRIFKPKPKVELKEIEKKLEEILE